MSRGGVGYDNGYADESYEILVSYRYSDGFLSPTVEFLHLHDFFVERSNVYNYKRFIQGFAAIRSSFLGGSPPRCLIQEVHKVGSDHLALVSEFAFELGTNEEKKETAASSSRTAFSKLQRRKLVGFEPFMVKERLLAIRARPQWSHIIGAGNIATAANFARRLLETNPTNESQAKKARQVLQAAERNMTDKSQLNYDFRNPFVICGATHVPIYRGQKDVSCPYYCSSRFVATQEGQFCTVCDLAVVGADASGLLCSPSQVR
ncbi:hypothetical protein FF2_015543 [Malus domestica]